MINDYMVEIIMAVVLSVVGYIVGRMYKKIEVAEKAIQEHNDNEITKRITDTVEPLKIKLAEIAQSLSDNDVKIQEQLKILAERSDEKDQKLKELFINDDRFQSIAAVIQTEEDLNKEFYKLQLINACKIYHAQGYMTQSQFDSLTTVHKIYKAFHGNSQGDDYYNMAMTLPIMSEEEGEKKFGKKSHINSELFVKEKDFGPHNTIVKSWDENN